MVSLLPHFNAARDAVYLCLPQEHAIIQQVFLPVAARENLSQVLEYEIERQLPFKREDIYYDYLPVGQKGEKLGVYVFAIPKKYLDGLLNLFDSFGIKLRGVETTATALANYLVFSGAPGESGGAALIAAHERSWEMIGVQTKAGGWTSTSELLFAHRLPASGWAQGSGGELVKECLSQVPKLYRCGELGALNGLVSDQLAQAEDLAAHGNPRLKGFAADSGADTLPALGAALHGVREAALAVNFLRHESGDGDGSKALSRANTILMALLALALIGWGASFPIKDELRLRQLRSENQKLEPSVQALRREDNQLQQLRKEIDFLSDREKRRGEVLRVLDELSKIVPNNVYFSNLRLRANVLEVQGNAENASALIPLLERSPLFENVGFNAPSNRGRDNRETFSLKADLEKPKDNAKEPAKPNPAPVKESKTRP
jgi:Tfp pilus assembly protein PilN